MERPVVDKEITALTDREKHLVMDWSPKAGCTILTKMFFRNMGILEKALSYNQWIHEYRMHVFSRETPSELKDLLNEENFRFKVVRNPFKRVVSSYIHVMKYDSMRDIITRTLWTWHDDISFSTFITFLSKIDIRNCDPHYSLQKKFFEYDLPDVFNRVIKLEDLEQEIEEINELTNAGFDISGLSSGHHIDRVDRGNKSFAGKGWSDIEKAIPPYKNFYTKRLAKKVYDIYREDFESYGYSMKDLPQ